MTVSGWIRWLAALAAVLGALSAMADPPARVGRLSLAEGAVSFRVEGQDGNGGATYNWPVSSGALLDTGADGRAEVEVGSSVFRLAGESSVRFAVVDDRRIALQVARGSLAVSVRDPADRIEIGTPVGQVRFGAPGRYRIDVDGERGDTQVSARDGNAYLDRPDGELVIPGGRRAVAYGSGGWFVTGLSLDGFDSWSDARDLAGEAPLTRRYVSPEMTGYEDLDRYGDWSSVPGYGAVWYPRAVAADWAPYRYGRWAWVPPWGWTWVDEAPWGFAPFHYGRWLFLGGRWAWVPGAYIARPVYAPALVAWIGDPGWNSGFAGPPVVGWFPLAPREVFIPSYRCSPDYVRRANINAVANVAAVDRAIAHPGKRAAFANRSLPQAVTVVPANVVRSGGAIRQAHILRPERRELSRAPVTAQAAALPGLSPPPPASPLPASRFPREVHKEPWASRPVAPAATVAASPRGAAGRPAPHFPDPLPVRPEQHSERPIAHPAAPAAAAAPLSRLPSPGRRPEFTQPGALERLPSPRPAAAMPRMEMPRMEPRSVPTHGGRESFHDRGKPRDAR